jgi:hypothetical protein
MVVPNLKGLNNGAQGWIGPQGQSYLGFGMIEDLNLEKVEDA